jgi:hypothetical protein
MIAHGGFSMEKKRTENTGERWVVVEYDNRTGKPTPRGPLFDSMRKIECEERTAKLNNDPKRKKEMEYRCERTPFHRVTAGSD